MIEQATVTDLSPNAFEAMYRGQLLTRTRQLSVIVDIASLPTKATYFNENVFGQEINIDIAHQPENGAGTVVRRLFTDRGRLRAEVEWYELGVNNVTYNK